MIIKAQLQHKMQIAEIWNEAFGDKIEDVISYLDFLLPYFFLYAENDTICAITAVLPLKYKEKSGGYIYAVATKISYRNRGISTKLINYIKNLPEYSFLVLVPQNPGLFDFYKKLEFVSFSSVTTKRIKVNKSIVNALNFKKISAEEYYNLRKSMLSTKLIEWGSEVLEFARAMYGGGFYSFSGNNIGGAFFSFVDNETIYIKEILSDNQSVPIEEIVSFFGTNSAVVSYPAKNCKPSAMIFPAEFDDIYFNIALD